jgi:hypothetical protein
MLSTGDKYVSINLSNDEAIVLLEWLTKFNQQEHSSSFEDPAEKRVLFDLETNIENQVSDTFKKDYNNILSKARERIRDKE